jgi:hypothetical protein
MGRHKTPLGVLASRSGEGGPRGTGRTFQAGRAHQWLGAGPVAGAMARASLPPAVAPTLRPRAQDVHTYGMPYFYGSGARAHQNWFATPRPKVEVSSIGLTPRSTRVSRRRG